MFILSVRDAGIKRLKLLNFLVRIPGEYYFKSVFILFVGNLFAKLNILHKDKVILTSFY